MAEKYFLVKQVTKFLGGKLVLVGPPGPPGQGVILNAEQAQDLVAPLFTHIGHTNLTATYDDVNNQINLSVSVPAGFTVEQAQDAAATMITGGTHTNVTWVYDDTANTLSASVSSEAIQDAVASLFTHSGHTNITWSYDDALNRLVATVGATYTDEQARDAVGAALAAGTHTGITVNVDDAGDKINLTVTAQGIAGRAGNEVPGANPSGVGPVYRNSSSGWVPAQPADLGLLTAQLAIRGSDNKLYTDGIVPFARLTGAATGDRLMLQATSGGTNVRVLAASADIPAGFNSATAAYVELGEFLSDTGLISFYPIDPLYDSSVKTDYITPTSLGDTKATVQAAFTAIIDPATTEFGPFNEGVAANFSGQRVYEVRPPQTPTQAFSRWLFKSFPSDSVTSVLDAEYTIVLGKYGATGDLVLAARATGTTAATYSAVEFRVNTGENFGTGQPQRRLFTVQNGVATQLGATLTAPAGSVSLQDKKIVLRLRVEGTSVKAKAWILGDPEPAAWDFDTTQSIVNNAGMMAYGTNREYVRWGRIGAIRNSTNPAPFVTPT